VPGDVLYPVKVRFNEEIRSSLSFGGYQKIAWETARVERRIAEARLLASEGKLTEEAQAAIEEEVQAHTEAAQKELAQLREDDEEDAVVAQVVLESALGVQSFVLDLHTQDDTSSSTGRDIRGIAGVVKEALDGVVATKVGTSTPSYERLVARVELETTRAQELFASVSESASNEEKLEIERRIEDKNRIISLAHTSFEEGQEDVAIQYLKTALSNTQKLITFMTDIDVRETVELETLVPKTLTQEERSDEVGNLLVEIALIIESLEFRVAAMSTEDPVYEKAALGLDEVVVLHASATEAFQSANNEVVNGIEYPSYDVAETFALQARGLAEDLKHMTEHVGAIETPIEEIATSTEAVELPVVEESASSTELVPEETATTTESVEIVDSEV
jgi:hypothetical protein